MKTNYQNGYTLVEVIVTIAIVSILFAVVMPRFFDFSSRARVAACKRNQTNIESAAAIGYASASIENNYTTQKPSYPSSIHAMVNAGFLDFIPVCPTGGSYEDSYNPANGTVGCSLSEHAR